MRVLFENISARSSAPMSPGATSELQGASRQASRETRHFSSPPPLPPIYSALPRGHLAQAMLDILALGFWIAFGLLEIAAVSTLLFVGALWFFGVIKF